MARPWVGYHASHEMLAPGELLRLVRQAESLGLQGAMCSDHLHPWSADQGQSGHSWSWLGAALASTRFSIGVVAAPGQRQHPALVAQAAATLESMFPRRFWLAAGSGENLNEHVTGDAWPAKAERDERLLECVQAMRRLWRGEEVTLQGRHVRVDRTRLWTRPARPPPLLAAALSPATAEWAASWADGLVTTGDLKGIQAATRAFRAKAPGRPVYAQVQVAWGRDDADAVEAAHRLWRFAALPYPASEDLATPEDFDAATRSLAAEDVAQRVVCSADPHRVADHLRRVASVADRVYVHGVTRDQDGFLRFLAHDVLPRLGDSR